MPGTDNADLRAAKQVYTHRQDYAQPRFTLPAWNGRNPAAGGINVNDFSRRPNNGAKY